MAPPPRRQDCRTLVNRCADGVSFHGAEFGLAGNVEDLGNADPRCLDDAGVTVDEGQVELLRQFFADDGLATPHHSNKGHRPVQNLFQSTPIGPGIWMF